MFFDLLLHWKYWAILHVRTPCLSVLVLGVLANAFAISVFLKPFFHVIWISIRIFSGLDLTYGLYAWIIAYLPCLRKPALLLSPTGPSLSHTPKM